MASKRRKEYLPIDKYPVYNKYFDRFRLESRVLNDDRFPTVKTILWDKGNAETELNKIRNQYMIAVKDGLKAIDENFKRLKQEKINQGYDVPRTMPTDLKEEQYRLHARMDVLTEEAEFLEMQLKKFADEEQRKRDSHMLEHGLICLSKNHGTGCSDPTLVNMMKVIDGQNVSMHKDGFLFIDDNCSPYDGMAIADYRKLAKKWVEKKIEDDVRLLHEMQMSAKENSEPIPYQTGRSLSSKVDRSFLPPYPSWAKKYK